MGYTFPGVETRKFQECANINQNNWNKRIAAVERLLVFDDGENESLEDDCSQLRGQNDSSHDSRFEAVC